MHTIVHMRGERRRAVALAGMAALVAYVVAYMFYRWVPSSGASHIFSLTGIEQGAVLAPIWLGVLIIALGQRELIARGEGIYGALLAISHVRGMSLVGLTFGFLTLASVMISFFGGTLSARFGIIGLLISSICFALGAPDAPVRNYLPDMPEMSPVQPTAMAPYVDEHYR